MRRFLGLLACLLGLAVQQVRPAAPPAKALPRYALGDELPLGAIARLGTSRFRFDGGIWEPALSPDGKLAIVDATVNGGGVKVVMDLATGRPVHSIANFYGSVWWMEISRDGRHLISADSRGIVTYDLRQKKHL